MEEKVIHLTAGGTLTLSPALTPGHEEALLTITGTGVIHIGNYRASATLDRVELQKFHRALTAVEETKKDTFTYKFLRYHQLPSVIYGTVSVCAYAGKAHVLMKALLDDIAEFFIEVELAHQELTELVNYTATVCEQLETEHEKNHANT